MEDNKHRGLNTEYPHSDAWVEGPWGYNVFVPMLGDCVNNTLRYYKIPENGLAENFFDQSKTYTTKQELVSSFVEMEDFIPKKDIFIYQTMLSCTKHGDSENSKGEGFNRYHIDGRQSSCASGQRG